MSVWPDERLIINKMPSVFIKIVRNWILAVLMGKNAYHSGLHPVYRQGWRRGGISRAELSEHILVFLMGDYSILLRVAVACRAGYRNLNLGAGL